MEKGGPVARRWLVSIGIALALVAPGGVAEATCKPFCAGGGLVSGPHLNPGDFFGAEPFIWSLSFDGFVGGQFESPRRLQSAARLYGVRTALNGNVASVAGTLTVFNEGSGVLFAVPMQITAVGTLRTNGTWSLGSAAIVPLAGGLGTGSSFTMVDTELRGALHAAVAREETDSTIIVSTLSTPSSYGNGEQLAIAGQVRTSVGTALPGVPVDILVDDNYVGRATTGQGGTWTSTLTFSDAQTHRVRAVAFRDTPMATSSPTNEIVPRVQLTISVSGVGSVSGSFGSCSATCTYAIAKGATLQLSATPDVSSTFAGWSGACAGTGACSVLMDQARTVGATFTLKSFVLSVAKVGSGSGTITSTPAGISCGSSCSASYTYGTQVTLTASPEVSSTFNGWSGACSGSGACTTTMTAARSVTAVFSLKSFALTVTKAGTGTGTVSSSPAGISCGSTCSATYGYGTMVLLNAAAAADSTFTGWSGSGCTGTGMCTVTMDQARSVTATFALKTFTLSVGISGNGTVSSSPAGISCNPTCSATFPYGTTVTLTATPGADSTFSGWTGDCYGAGGCSIVMTEARMVNASFSIAYRSLTVSRNGAGNGTVTSAPVGISCGSTCFATYQHGTQVTLTAAADASSSFAGWSGGGCSGTGTCVVMMDQARTITATFTLINADIVETEPNDTIGTANGVPVPTRFAGSAPSGDVDVVSISLGSQTPVRIQTFDATGTGCASIDTVIRLLNADGSQRAFDDDGGVPLCSRIDALLPAGTYYVEVTPYGSTSIGSYRLHLTVVTTADLYEPNNTRQTARNVGFGEPVMAAINPVGDLDFYRFTLATTETIEAETFDGPNDTCASIDTVVRIQNSAGTEVGVDDDGGIGLCSQVNVTLPAGTYTVSVEDYQNNHTIALYRLRLRIIDHS
jgi:hypothetical protein